MCTRERRRVGGHATRPEIRIVPRVRSSKRRGHVADHLARFLSAPEITLFFLHVISVVIRALVLLVYERKRVIVHARVRMRFVHGEITAKTRVRVV